MAKLSARGRTELARISKEDCDPISELIIWRRKTLALMSDRTVLEKLDVRFKPDSFFNPRGELYSYGWKVKGKAKPELTPERFREIYAKAGYQ